MRKLLYIILMFVIIFSCVSCSQNYEVADGSDNIVIKLSDDNLISLNKISAGTFKMGSYEGFGDEDEQPVREVTITDDYYIGVCEITQKQWNAVMGENPSNFKGDNFPVESVTWLECIEFCKKLSERTGCSVTLPTEAQWEYACRAGSETKWFFGENETEFGKYANADTEAKTIEVAQFMPNPNGLYDMYGNVMEWCLDYYAPEYVEEDTQNPVGPSEGDARVSRGGGWGANPDDCRSAYRNACGEDEKSDGIGLRIVINK